MSELSDKIAAAKNAVANATTRVVADIDKFKAEIARLQALVDAGTATAQDLQDLDDLKIAVDQLDPSTTSTIPG